MYIEDITRLREDMNVMLEWQEQYLTSERRTISHEKPIQQKQKAGIVTSLNDTTLTKVTYGKYATRQDGSILFVRVANHSTGFDSSCPPHGSSHKIKMKYDKENCYKINLLYHCRARL